MHFRLTELHKRLLGGKSFQGFKGNLLLFKAQMKLLKILGYILSKENEGSGIWVFLLEFFHLVCLSSLDNCGNISKPSVLLLFSCTFQNQPCFPDEFGFLVGLKSGEGTQLVVKGAD